MDIPIIAFTGRQRSGKTTAAAYIDSRVPGTARLSFAEPLRELCQRMFKNVPAEHFRGSQEDKNRPIPGLEPWTGRRILQHIGTEGFRHIEPGIWGRLLRERIHQLAQMGGTALVVIDDVRFLNEAEALLALPSCLLVRTTWDGEERGDSHASEQDVDTLPVHHTIIHNGSLAEYYAQLNNEVLSHVAHLCL